METTVNTDAMRWAIERSGHTVEELKRKWSKLEQWLDGSRTPTLNQIQEFAKRTHVSLDLLFQESVPELDLQIADFRTTKRGFGGEPSPELYDTITQMQFRQDWLRDYFRGIEAEKVDLVGFLADSACQDVFAAAEAIRGFLDLKETWAFAERDCAAALKTLRDKVEAKRISVVINGVVGDNTSRPLNVDEFRGFVLSDEFAPIIFINGRDAKCAQIFTMVHELAHLAFARTGVVEPSECDGDSLDQERFCDRVAAEFLVSQGAFLGGWREESSAFDNIESARKCFKVSFMVCARKAFDLGLIDRAAFCAAVEQHKAEVPSQDRLRHGSGGDYYLNKAYRVGGVFGDAVYVATQARQITYQDAFRLTGLNAKTFDRYFKGYAA